MIAFPLLAVPLRAQTSSSSLAGAPLLTSAEIAASAVTPEGVPEGALPPTDAGIDASCQADEDGKVVCDGYQPKRKRIFPIWADKARDRHIPLPRPWGAGVVVVSNNQDFSSNNLAVSFSTGSTPPPEDVTDVPFVTTDQLRGYTDTVQFKADLWILAGLNAFISFGKAKGPMDIGVNIDLDAFLPPPICRPAQPCGVKHLDFQGHIDNTTGTFGTILAYGGRHWFVSGALSQTLSISSKGRSDVKTTNGGLRAGPRFEIARWLRMAPYVGVNYFDMDTTITGTYSSPPALPNGDAINIRYRIDLTTKNPWAYILGASVELNTRWQLQFEYDGAPDADRIIASLAFRI